MTLAGKLTSELIQTLMPVLDSLPDNHHSRTYHKYYKDFRRDVLDAFKRAVELRSKLELGDQVYQFHWFSGGVSFVPDWMEDQGGDGGYAGNTVLMCLFPAISIEDPEAPGEPAIYRRAAVYQVPPYGNNIGGG